MAIIFGGFRVKLGVGRCGHRVDVASRGHRLYAGAAAGLSTRCDATLSKAHSAAANWI